MQKNPDQCPTWDEFLRPLLELASESPIMRRTATQAIADLYAFSEEIRSERLKSGQTRIQNRAGWAMSSLVKAKFIEKHSTEKFTYQITENGKQYLSKNDGPITTQDLNDIDGFREAWQQASEKRQRERENTRDENTPRSHSTPDDLIDAAYHDLNQSLSNELLETMVEMDPYKFEKLVVDLLFAMGYGGSRNEAAQVTKKSNDEGVDGVINEDRLGLDVIYVQAKRYQVSSSIGRKEIQSFVGALAGKQANKGVFITTSDFATTAVDYANAVSQKVILINGHRLSQLMIEHNVGVAPQRTIQIKKIDSDYFLED